MPFTTPVTAPTPPRKPLGSRIIRGPWAALLLVTALSTASACDILGKQGFSDLGTIVSFGDTAAITVPDSAGVGKSFSVSIETFGGGCTQEVDRTEHEVQDMVADITPWDWNSGALDCPADVKLLHHEVQLSFDQPGTATIHIIGLEEGVQGSTEIQLARQVVIH